MTVRYRATSLRLELSSHGPLGMQRLRSHGGVAVVVEGRGVLPRHAACKLPFGGVQLSNAVISGRLSSPSHSAAKLFRARPLGIGSRVLEHAAHVLHRRSVPDMEALIEGTRAAEHVASV